MKRRSSKGPVIGLVLSLMLLAAWLSGFPSIVHGRPAEAGTGAVAPIDNEASGGDEASTEQTGDTSSGDPSATPTHLLVLGIDERPRDVGRSDTMMLVRVEKDQVRVLSIPRDTRVYLDEYGYVKVNAAYVYGGAELAKQAVSDLLGIEVDHYVKVNTAGFRELVDLIGGVELEVPKRMYYRDDDQGLVINLQPGLQRLDGEQAEQFVRFRYDESGDDISRIKRQQDFLKAAAKQALTPSNLLKLPQLLSKAASYVSTDMGWLKQIQLAQNLFAAQRADQITLELVPGDAEYIDGISYFLADEKGLQGMIRGW